MLFFCCILTANLVAQIPTFKKRHGTAGNDEARFVEVLPDNSFVVAGSSTGGGLGGTDAMLVKFNEDGSVAWSKAYGGSGNDVFTHILACSDGNYIAYGETNSFGAGGTDLFLVKFDANGNVIWQRTCGGASAEWASGGVCEVSDGYVVSGSTQSFGAGFWDVFVEKLDLSGGSLWAKSWGSGGGDGGGEPLPAGNDDVWVSGGCFVGSNNHDALLLRISPNGTLLSARRTGGNGNEGGECLAYGGAGIVVSSHTWTYSNGTQIQPWLLSYNTSGNFVWGKRYILPNGNYFNNAEDCPDGGFVFALFNHSTETNDAFLVKTDANGDITWAKSHAYNGAGRLRHARPCPDGGYVAVGFASGNGNDMFILKTDGNGNVAGCCPTDVSIIAAAITPGSPTLSPQTANGPTAGTPSGQDQAVGLTEANLCNGPSCCLTEAGTMLAETLTVCANAPATFTHLGDEVLEAGDLLQFILFSNPGDTMGSIQATNNTPVFTFDPATMQTGVPYYVAAIAGDNVGGNVDLNDPCLDISNAAILLWRALPEVNFATGNPDVCPGDCRSIEVTLVGTPPFTLTVSSPAGDQTVSFSSNTGSFVICPPPGTPPGSFTVQATMLADAFCDCP